MRICVTRPRCADTLPSCLMSFYHLLSTSQFSREAESFSQAQYLSNSITASPGSILESGGCFTNVSRALQNNIAKMYNARNNIYAENFKLKSCTCAQSMALVTRTKFQLEILIRIRF